MAERPGRTDALRVLHVVEAVETGLIRHVVDVVTGVDADHHLALPRRRMGGGTDERAITRLADAASDLHQVGMRRSAASPANLAAVVAVRGLVRSLRPDVVHGHSTVGGAVARLAAVGTGTPVVYTPNGLSPRRSARVAERVLRPLTGRFVAVSASEACLARERGLVDAGRLVVIPNGVEPSPPPPAARPIAAMLHLPEDAVLVGAVGRLSAQKAPEVVIAAWGRVAARHPGAHFVWIGDGEQREDAERAIAASGATERIHLLGHVDEAAAHLGELTVFTSGSRFEGGPYAPLEAMRSGVPVVGTDVVGTRDCIDDGRTGLLVPPDDPEALAGAIDRLLGDAALRRRLAAEGKRVIRTGFSPDTMTAALTELYREVARGGRRAGPMG